MKRFILDLGHVGLAGARTKEYVKSTYHTEREHVLVVFEIELMMCKSMMFPSIFILVQYMLAHFLKLNHIQFYTAQVQAFQKACHRIALK